MTDAMRTLRTTPERAAAAASRSRWRRGRRLPWTPGGERSVDAIAIRGTHASGDVIVQAKHCQGNACDNVPIDDLLRARTA